MLQSSWQGLPLRAVLVTTTLWPGLAGVAPLTDAQPHAVSSGRATLTCPLRTGGRIEARTTTVRGLVVVQPGMRDVGGALVADMRDLDAGAPVATSQVRENLLEVYRGDGYASITIADLILDAPFGPDTKRAGVRARVTMHGQTRAVTGTYALRRRGDVLDLQLTIDLRLDDFGMAPPSHPALRVTGTMQYTLKVTLQPTSAP